MLDLSKYIEQIKFTHPGLLPVIAPFVEVIEQLEEENKAFRMENALLKEKCQSLEDRLGKHSGNSSKPPSQDKFGKKVKNNRTQSSLKQGAQKGHKGHSLSFTQTPDKTVLVPTEQCNHCGTDLSKTEAKCIKRYQCHDLPEELKLIVTEYQVEQKSCPYCRKTAEHELGFNSSTCYGPRVSALVSYLYDYQQIPYDRLQDLSQDVFGRRLSDGFLQSSRSRLHSNLQASEEGIKEKLKACRVVHADETSVNHNGKVQWIHVCSDENWTYYHADQKRGYEAIERADILPNFQEFVVHDRFGAYNKGNYIDCLCNAHLLRELKFFFEDKGEIWAKKLYDLLIWIKDSKAIAPISSFDLNLFENQYDHIVLGAYLEYCLNQPPPVNKRGRPKKSKEANLINALLTQKYEVLRFMFHAEVPFDNNQAERDLRMVKLKNKISGGFRTFENIEIFARIRSYIGTAKKQGYNILDALILAFQGKPLFT